MGPEGQQMRALWKVQRYVKKRKEKRFKLERRELFQFEGKNIFYKENLNKHSKNPSRNNSEFINATRYKINMQNSYISIK